MRLGILKRYPEQDKLYQKDETNYESDADGFSFQTDSC